VSLEGEGAGGGEAEIAELLQDQKPGWWPGIPGG